MAILTKYHNPTNARGSRVSATCEAGRVVIPWDDGMDTADNHRAAVAALLSKLKWPGAYVGSEMKGGGFAFVRAASQLMV